MNRDSEYFQILDKLRGPSNLARVGHLFIPQLIIETLRELLDGKRANIICDPWAGIGRIIAEVQDITQAKTALAFTRYRNEATFGREFAKNAQWYVGDPLDSINKLRNEIDVFASVLPFVMRWKTPLTVTIPSGERVVLRNDLGNLILVAAAKKLLQNGIGIFVITPTFFFSSKSVLHHFNSLGIGIEAAFELPSGAFAPYTNIPTYLAIIRNHPVSDMFIAGFSSDAHTNNQIISNYRQGKEGGRLELGRFVKPLTFRGLADIRRAEKFQQVERQYGSPAQRLEDVSLAINMGRSGDDFDFPKLDNVVFIPLIGISDVLVSQDDLTLKCQNYAQVVINPTNSNARFVAHFLNSDFGKDIREANKHGVVIRKLNKNALMQLEIFIPDLQTQKQMLEIESQITAEQNTLLGLQNEIIEFRRELWSNPNSIRKVLSNFQILSSQFSGNMKQYAAESLVQWFETLPFPLASILRAWQVTSSDDFKTKYEHLLHFFEANAEFLSIILLSAFSSQEAFFGPHRNKLIQALRNQNLSFRRATFGTWKITIEYLAKQSRDLLEGNKEAREMCATMFTDVKLAEMLERKELLGVLNITNRMRNDWLGHGGVVSQTEAKLRNEQLIAVLQKLRQIMGDVWGEIQLIRAENCRPRHGVFDNEVALLMGSNSEFLRETRLMSIWMDVELLYLASKNTGRALPLLPLITIGPSPESAKNACYFFNRVEKEGVRFVSYHFMDRPELIEDLVMLSVLKSLIET